MAERFTEWWPGRQKEAGHIIIVIGVNLGSDPPIDGQIRHFNPAIVNLNFPQGFLWGGRSKSGGWQEPHDRKESQEHRNQSFFHERPP